MENMSKRSWVLGLLMSVIFIAIVVTFVIFLGYGVNGIEVATKTLESHVGMLSVVIISMLVTIGMFRLVVMLVKKRLTKE